MSKNKQLPEVKERKALNKLHDHLQQRRAYLNANFTSDKVIGSFTEITLLENFITPLIKPILKSEQRDCPVSIGDSFYLKEDPNKKEYIVTSFPYLLTVSGVCPVYQYSSPLSITCYYKDCVKIEKNPPKPKEKVKKIKPTKIKVGEYFSTNANNAIFKVLKVKKGIVIGKNELTNGKLPNKIKVITNKTKIIPKTKKEYKKFHKAK